MSAQAELWQGYTEQGEPDMAAGVTIQQSATGALHGSAHVWLWRRDPAGEIELLLQQRAADMPTWPGYWSVSAAGHQAFGESIETTAIRETYEEIGLQLTVQDLKLLFTYRQRRQPTASIIENEIQWVYAVNGSRQRLRPGVEEVSGLQWFVAHEIRAMLEGASEHKIVPHGSEYFEKLVAGLA